MGNNYLQPGTRYEPIENYGIIGNLHTVALVSLAGSIDFMSFMRFDSPTIFCRMLDADKGGHFSIQPQMSETISKQLYLPDTNILFTRFFANEGIAELKDFMPVNESEFNCAVVRQITTIRGNIKYKMVCAPRFNYARTGHSLLYNDGVYTLKPDGTDQTALKLLSNVTMQSNGNDVVAEFTLNEGETAYFVLEAEMNTANRDGCTLHEYVENTYHSTINYWQQWIAKCTYKGAWQDIVHRSALTLKLLISHRYGSMIAAPTFSLPESIGEGRNWDYRYTWIRDAAFSMHAFLQLGFMDEAEAFLGWVQEQSVNNQLQLMFRVDGDTDIKEEILPHLEGYKGSRPVRIGNDAYRQVQMDIYGELLETVYIYMLHGGNLTYDFWLIIERYIKVVIENWRNADHSIWEIRGEKQNFLYSRMMSWIAVDRAIKIATSFSFPFDIIEWHKVRDEIFYDVYNNFWNEEKQAFVQYKGSSNIDASVMLMPILNMLSPFSDRWQKTMEAIDKELRLDVLIYRYKEDEEVDGLKGEEGTFTMCSFWYVECLAISGQMGKAREYFEKMVGYANHLGLFAEELGIKGEHLGNFPQAFTHLALISAAIELNKADRAHVTKLSLHKDKMK